MNRIKTLMILLLLLLLFITTNSNSVNNLFYASNENKSKNVGKLHKYYLLDSLHNIAPKYEALECIQFRVITDTIVNYFKINSSTFIQVYQVDSLIKDFGWSDPPPELIGSFSYDGYKSLIVQRYYGEWFITLDFLVYDTNNNLIGYLILAALGGDESYFYEGYGYFEDDNLYKYYEFFKSSDEEFLSKNSNMICSQRIYRYFIDFVNGIRKELIIVQKVDCK